MYEFVSISVILKSFIPNLFDEMGWSSQYVFQRGMNFSSWLKKCWRRFQIIKNIKTNDITFITHLAENGIVYNTCITWMNQSKLYICYFYFFLSVHQGVMVIIYKGLCFDLAQGQMNGAPNETHTHLCRFANLVC